MEKITTIIQWKTSSNAHMKLVEKLLKEGWSIMYDIRTPIDNENKDFYIFIVLARDVRE